MKPRHLLLIAILAASAAIMLHHARLDSVSYDENLHLRSAVEWLTTGTSPSDPFNPPLAKLPTGILSVLAPVSLQDPFLLLPRATTILITLGLLLTVYAWAKAEYSTTAALIATFLLAFSPTLLAHGHLVTTDILATLTYFLAVTRFLAWFKEPNSEHWLLFWVSFTLMAATKITLLPMLTLFLAFFAILSPTRTVLVQGLSFLSQLTPRQVFVIVYPLLLSPLLLWAIYGFHFKPILNLTPPLPLGEFANTLAHAFSNSTNPKFAATRQLIYMGEVSGTGWFSYPLVSLPLKSSPAFLMLLPITLISLLQKTNLTGSLKSLALSLSPRTKTRKSVRLNKPVRSGRVFSTGVLLPPALAVFTIITLGRYSTGIRHLLPMYPFLAIFIATYATPHMTQSVNFLKRLRHPERFWRRWSHQKIAGSPTSYLLATLLVFHLVNALLLTPDPIAYFNPLFPQEKAYTIMADSNLDWGQSTARLSQELDPQTVDFISTMTTSPERYGFTDLQPIPKPDELTPEIIQSNVFAISATRYYTEGYHRSILKNYNPTVRAHGTYLIY